MSTTPEPTDDQLAAWLAGDLDADTDGAVTAAVREDPAVAERAGALAEVLARLARRAPTPPPPPAPVEAIMAAIAQDAEHVPASQPLPVVAAATGPAGGLHRTSIRPPDDPAFTRRLERSSGRGGGTSTRPGGAPGRRRRDRALSGVAVLALLALLATVGIQALRDGGPFGGQDPTATTAPDQADGRGQDEGGQTEEDVATDEDGADDSEEGTDGEPLEGALDDGPSETDDGDVAGLDPSPSPALDPDRPALPAEEATTDSAPAGSADGDTAAGDAGAATGGPGAGAPDPAPAPQPAPRPTTDPPPADDEAAAPPPGEDPADGDAGGDQGGGEEGAPGDAPAAPDEGAEGDREMTSPTVADSMVDLPDAAAVQAHFANRPEAQQLIGLSGVEARERAARHARDVGSSPPFAWGVHPSDCLDAATAGPGTTVIAAVESATYAGQRALAHLVVTGSDSLTRAFAVITDCTTCEVLLRVEVDV